MRASSPREESQDDDHDHGRQLPNKQDGMCWVIDFGLVQCAHVHYIIRLVGNRDNSEGRTNLSVVCVMSGLKATTPVGVFAYLASHQL